MKINYLKILRLIDRKYRLPASEQQTGSNFPNNKNI